MVDLPIEKWPLMKCGHQATANHDGVYCCVLCYPDPDSEEAVK